MSLSYISNDVNIISVAASSSPQTDAAKAEAEAIITAMQGVSFDHQPALDENVTATTVLKDLKKFVRPLENLQKDLGKVSEKIKETKDKLEDLKANSANSIATSRKANEISNKIKDAKFSAKLAVLEKRATDMLENAAIGTELNAKSPEILQDLETSYIDLGIKHFFEIHYFHKNL